jgi:hypothetical protein
MLKPILSLTEEQGLKNSNFATTSATQPLVILLSRTKGVLPMSLVISLAIFGI